MQPPPPGASRALVTSLAAGPGVRIFAALPALDDTTERPITVDQTNHSVVVGERVVVKWYTPPAPPPQRAPDLLAHLVAAGFEHTATPYAAVYRGADLVALVTAYLPDAVDGWDWCVEAALAGEGFAAGLGTLAADLHAALATPTPRRPGPVTTGDPSAWHARALAALDEAVACTGDPWLDAVAPRLRAGLEPLAAAGPTPVMPIHGDLHVGQVLRWRDGYAVVDFDGNPTVEADGPQPAARDVAQMETSLAHVGQIAVRRGGDPARTASWVREETAAFRAAYTDRLAVHRRSSIFEVGLVAPFAVEQECRELIYAARSLPRWRYAPMGVLRTWYGAPDGR